jgi:hypothetical protein
VTTRLSQSAADATKIAESWMHDRQLDIPNWGEQKLYQTAVQDSLLRPAAGWAAEAALSTLKEQYTYYEDLFLTDAAPLHQIETASHKAG